MSTRRRRSRRERQQRWLSGYWLWGAGAVLAIIILTPVVMNLVGGDSTPAILEDHVEQLPDEGRDHVPDGTPVQYGADPPASGPHFARWAETGFHTDPIPYELLVHNLEHGQIVIYYDPVRLSNETAEALGELTSRHSGTWDGVLAVPRPDDQYELILTAWTYRMHLEEYDAELVDAFVDAYRGRGPENPVR
jgi:hypothetical protein